MYFVKAEKELFFFFNCTIPPFKFIRSLERNLPENTTSAAKWEYFLILFSPRKSLVYFDLAVCYFISKPKQNKSYN